MKLRCFSKRNIIKDIQVQSWTKKHTTRCYSYTYHRKEMKLVPFFMEKCPHYRYVKEESLRGRVHIKKCMSFKIFNTNTQF